MYQLQLAQVLVSVDSSSQSLSLSHLDLCFQSLAPYGIGVATGEACQNRVIFKQLLQAKAIKYCQIDAGRLAGPNEVVTVILMAAKFGGANRFVVHWLRHL